MGGRQLRRDLRVRLPALRGVVEEIDVRKEHLEKAHVVAGPADAGFEIRVPQRPEEPHLVAFDRPAQAAVELAYDRGCRRPARARRTGVAARARRAVVDVVAVPTLRLIGVRRRPLERIAAALGDDVDVEARAHRGRGVDAARLHLNVVDHVGAHRHVRDLRILIVGRDRALELHHVREVLGTVAEIHHAAAAVVERARVDAWRDLEEVAPIAARLDRHFALKLAGDIQHVARLADLEHRRFAGDRNRFLQGADLHHDVDLKVRARAQ